MNVVAPAVVWKDRCMTNVTKVLKLLPSRDGEDRCPELRTVDVDIRLIALV